MREALLSYGQYIRLAAFGGVFALMAAWEFIGPRRSQTFGRGWRWPNNLGVVAVDTLLVRILFPTTAVGMALVAEAHGLGAQIPVPLCTRGYPMALSTLPPTVTGFAAISTKAITQGSVPRLTQSWIVPR